MMSVRCLSCALVVAGGGAGFAAAGFWFYAAGIFPDLGYQLPGRFWGSIKRGRSGVWRTTEPADTARRLSNETMAMAATIDSSGRFNKWAAGRRCWLPMDAVCRINLGVHNK